MKVIFFSFRCIPVSAVSALFFFLFKLVFFPYMFYLFFSGCLIPSKYFLLTYIRNRLFSKYSTCIFIPFFFLQYFLLLICLQWKRLFSLFLFYFIHPFCKCFIFYHPDTIISRLQLSFFY